MPFSPSIGADSDASRPASALSGASGRSGSGWDRGGSLSGAGSGAFGGERWREGSDGDLAGSLGREIGMRDGRDGRDGREGMEGDTALPAYSRDKAKREKERRRRGSKGSDMSGRERVRDLVGLVGGRKKERRRD